METSVFMITAEIYGETTILAVQNAAEWNLCFHSVSTKMFFFETTVAKFLSFLGLECQLKYRAGRILCGASIYSADFEVSLDDRAEMLLLASY